MELDLHIIEDTEGFISQQDSENLQSCSVILKEEEEQICIHLIDDDATMRTSLFRLFRSVGFYCEIYASAEEFLAFRPSRGIVLYREEPGNAPARDMISTLRTAGLTHSLVAYGDTVSVEAVVDAMRHGALSFLTLPFNPDGIEQTIRQLAQNASSANKLHHYQLLARQRVGALSPREREVLDLISDGCSNKEAGRRLGISPRTVEIHRMKMMSRLGAASAAEAVRIRILADLGEVP